MNERSVTADLEDYARHICRIFRTVLALLACVGLASLIAGAFFPTGLTALVVTLPAHASTEPMTTGRFNGRAPDELIETAARPNNGARIPTGERDSSLGGAVYSPFAETSEKPMRRDVQTGVDLIADAPSLTFTAITALAAGAALACIVRRAWSA